MRYVQLNAETAQSLNIKQTEGAYVSGSNGQSAVIVGSPAEKAGIKEGDIILEIDGKKVTTSNTLSAIINQHKVGDKVTIKILRGDKQDNLTATLQQLP